MAEPTLFDITDEPTPTVGREPAPWITTHGGPPTTGYTQGCRCAACTEAWRDYGSLLRRGLRRCQHCRDTYPRTAAGGGTKFCAACIQGGVYQRNVIKPALDRTCARCDTPYRRASASPWDLCHGCTKHPVFQRMKGALGQHHAPTDLVLAVMDWPYCANEQCGAWLLNRAHHKRTDRSSSRYTYDFVVDHDHACCPTERSCGSCIRGVICRGCNNAMPHTLDAIRAQGILDYLTQT